MAVLVWWKEAGPTPLQALNSLKIFKPELVGIKMTYAGRLDPLALGVMIVLTGEDVFNKEQYLGLSKEYRLKILLGVGTDSGDVLGLVTSTKAKVVAVEDFKKTLPTFTGQFEQEYPRFSAPKIDGHTNFSKTVVISNIDFLGEDKLTKEVLMAEVADRISKVVGDFRQAYILARWEEVESALADELTVMSVLVTCSSGTYMRVLAEKLGETLGVPALAWEIERVKVGEFGREDCINL